MLKVKPELSFQLAEKTDGEAIFSFIVQEAQNGHFNKAYVSSRLSQQGLRDQVLSSINSKKMKAGIWRTVNARIYVLKNVQNEFLGFMWIQDFKRWLFCHGKELYMGGVVEGYRKKGFGYRLIQECLDVIPDDESVHVRTMPASTKMEHILQTNGFIKTRPDNKWTTHWIRK